MLSSLLECILQFKMNRIKHPYFSKEAIVMSNGSIFIAKSIHNYKKYNDQSTDIFNNSKWNPVIQENIGDSFKGQHLRFRKRYNVNLVD